MFVMDGSNQEAVWSTSADNGDSFNFKNSGAKTTYITSLDSNGFTLGSSMVRLPCLFGGGRRRESSPKVDTAFTPSA